MLAFLARPKREKAENSHEEARTLKEANATEEMMAKALGICREWASLYGTKWNCEKCRCARAGDTPQTRNKKYIGPAVVSRSRRRSLRE